METFGPYRALALLACSSLAWSGAAAQSQGASSPSSSRGATSTAKRVEAMQQQLREQGRQIEALLQFTVAGLLLVRLLLQCIDLPSLLLDQLLQRLQASGCLSLCRGLCRGSTLALSKGTRPCQ